MQAALEEEAKFFMLDEELFSLLRDVKREKRVQAEREQETRREEQRIQRNLLENQMEGLRVQRDASEATRDLVRALGSNEGSYGSYGYYGFGRHWRRDDPILEVLREISSHLRNENAQQRGQPSYSRGYDER